MKLVIQANLDLRNSSFPFSNLELFDLRNIYVLNLKTSLQKMPYVCKLSSFLNREFTVLRSSMQFSGMHVTFYTLQISFRLTPNLESV